MKRVDAAGHVGNLFVEGDVGTGQPATVLDASWHNAVQEEIANVIENAGIALNPAEDDQLYQAIGTLIGQRTGFRSAVVNGDFRLWQRTGTLAGSTTLPLAISTTALFAPDRWRVRAGVSGGAATITRGEFAAGQSSVEGNPRYYLDWNQTTGAAGGRPLIEQPIEGVDTLAGQLVTLSFSARVQAGTLQLLPTLRQDFGSGGSADVLHPGSELVVGTGWTRFSFTTQLGSIGGKTIGTDHYLAIVLEPATGVTFHLELADVQLEPGASATAFERRPDAIELIFAQRFYEKSWEVDVQIGKASAVGEQEGALALGVGGGSISAAHANRPFSTQKYRVPTVVSYGHAGTAARITTPTGPTEHAVDANHFRASRRFVGYPTGGSTLPTSGTFQWFQHWAAEAEIPA
jgi:hypothetical protein